MFGLNPVQIAKSELKKLDLDRDGVPDVYEALDAAEEVLANLADFLSTFDEDEICNILQALNAFRAESKREPRCVLHEIAAKLVRIPDALRKAQAALDAAETELKR